MIDNLQTHFSPRVLWLVTPHPHTRSHEWRPSRFHRTEATMRYRQFQGDCALIASFPTDGVARRDHTSSGG
jgi:hypothetical protein